MNNLQLIDFKTFAEDFCLSASLANSSFLITGATGLIGSTLVGCLSALNVNISITCPVRSLRKAHELFGKEYKNVTFVECDSIEGYLEGLSPHNQYQYIVHCASPTDGKYMTEHPVETFEFSVNTTKSLLVYAKNNPIKGLVYVSSLEYYGQNHNNNFITEDFQGYINSTSSRSSYPMGKRAAEFLCYIYATEYNIPAKVARLTQTFGAGVSKTDNRVFAQFARSVINGNDIVLHTTGESSKPYCYTTDCISAILYVLVKGEKGEAYNVANPDTFISIREMAEFLRDEFAPTINVVVDIHPEYGYAPVTCLNLSTKKLESLGWKPKYRLKQMFDMLINSIKEDSNAIN